MLTLYPRVIAIHRPRQATGVGNVGYSGLSPANEDEIATNLPASIQTKGMGRVTNAGITPSDSPGPTQWRIFIPMQSLAQGVAKDRDVVTDDENIRYQVVSAYWNILGYRLDCIRLEA